MDESFWPRLADAVRDHPDLYRSAGACRGYLMDYYPAENEREIRLIVQAVEIGIPTYLEANKDTIPHDQLFESKVEQMKTRFYLRDDAAEWTVKAWMHALNIPVPPVPPPASSQPTTPKPSNNSHLSRWVAVVFAVALLIAGAIYGFHRISPIHDDGSGQAALEPSGQLINEPVAFLPGSTTLKEESKDLIKEALPKVQAQSSLRFIIEAHLIPGDSADDEKLAKDRADEVKRFLVGECQISEARIDTKVLGEAQAPAHLPSETEREWARRARAINILLAK